MTPDFNGFSVEPVTAARSHLGARKIVAWSVRPFGANTTLRAWVGDQELQAITVDQFGLSFVGYAANVPDAADTLKYQIVGGDKTDTGLTATAEPGVA